MTSRVSSEDDLIGNSEEWNNRSPSFGKTVRSLLRRSSLIKIRDISNIVSEIIAIVIVILLSIISNLGKTPTAAITETKKQTMDDMYGSLIVQYMKIKVLGEGGNFLAGPNTDISKDIIGKFFNAHQIPNIEDGKVTGFTNITEKFTFVNDLDDFRKSFERTTASSYGLLLNDASNSQYKVSQSAYIAENNQFATFFPTLSQAFAEYTYENAGPKMAEANAAMNAILQEYINSVTDNDLKAKLAAQLQNTSITNFNIPNITAVAMERPELKNGVPINLAVQFLSSLPAIIAAMPDLSLILEDKESHMMTFIFLMGSSETAYYLVSFITTFVMCLIPYLIMAIIFSGITVMKGTNFILIIVFAILYIISYIIFQAFLSTFFTKRSTGRIIITIFLIATIFFGYLNTSYTVKAPTGVKHIFSIIPFEAWEQSINVMFEVVRTNGNPLSLSDVGRNDLGYPLLIGILWFILDMIIWGLLFLLFNATNSRGFGSPPLRWIDIIKCHFMKKRDIELDNVDNNETLIQVDNLKKMYPEQKKKKQYAIDDVSFDIKKGEIIVMIGPNGAGKSSIINVVAGAIPATDGTMMLGDQPKTKQFGGIQKCLGIVFQENVIYRLLSIREHLEIFGRIRGIDEGTLQDNIDFFADNLQLREMLPNRAGDLSGGQKRKLCIALSLLGNPPIIMMDEPTAGVDVQARQLIWKTISNLKNSTCIITTHALEEAEAVSSRMFVVSKGKIPFLGTSTELRNKFKCGYILKLDCDETNMAAILKICKEFIPGSSIVEERNDTISIPVDKNIGKLLKKIDENKEKLAIDKYSFTVEQLEDVLLRILEH